MGLLSKPRCPYCDHELQSKPKSNISCPQCERKIVVFQKKLHTQEDAHIAEWLHYLKPLGVTRRDFDRNKKELDRLAKKSAFVNDVLWSILNELVVKHPGNRQMQYRAYLAQAELVASEWKDPMPYLELAGKHSPMLFASLEWHRDPQDVMIVEDNRARELENQGQVDEAIAIYENLVKHRYPHPSPYERLRILYSKRKDYRKAIRACKAFRGAHKSWWPHKANYPERVARFHAWIPKLEERLEKQKAKKRTR